MNLFLEKLKNKYCLYLLCFMALNLIEFLRATQRGNIWAAAVNCTGLVMMVIIFSQLPIKKFMKPITFIYTVICIFAIVLVRLHWLQHVGEYYFGQIVTAIMNIWWLGLTIPYFLRNIFEEKKMKVHLDVLSWSWIVFTVWSAVCVAGRWWPIWFFLMFGSFYLVRFSERDKTALMDALIDGTIVSFFVIQSYAYLFRPYDTLRYRGAFSNSNMMALYYLIVYCMILFKLHLLHVKKAKIGWKLFYFMGAAGMLSFILLTISRTALIGAVMITLVYGYIVVHRAWKCGLQRLISQGFVLLLCTVLIFPVVFLTVRWLPTIHPHPVWSEGEYHEKPVRSWDPPNSEKYVDMDEFLNQLYRTVDSVLSKIAMRDPMVLHAKASSEFVTIPEPDASWQNSIWGIRKAFFQTYWKYSTWLGHPEEDGYYVFEESGIRVWHGQNLWIQFVYYFGYPAGVLLILIIFSALFKTVNKAKDISHDPYAAIPLILLLVYLGFGLTEIVWNPGQLILTLIFVVMHPRLTNREGKQENV